MYSDFIVYVDESGDHSLVSIDTDYPVFVLTFCIFNKQTYTNKIVPNFQNFKFKYFGHDIIIFHENEIRRKKNNFKFLNHPTTNNVFMSELNEIISQSDFKVLSCIIHKEKLKQRFSKNDNPYHIALGICLDMLQKFLKEYNQADLKTYIVVEKRGHKEDTELESEFNQICTSNNYHFEIILADKKTNSTGLQLSDMIARPIGRNLLNSKEPNRAYEIIKTKFYGNGVSKGIGLKIYP
ncbi:DUF3800 domain-containing protein [Arcobacter sp. FWKO B]|uniref:DUF3800 domain-containing protein n=1 Tax=Arcobacter sp. FWKO B TaxID=2593672 RepID=UPI0018A5487C|nr:DUF3800 domain-containing protein [Arcobacter sp. FWKO B]QOG12119.1 DUF3800 domain-containing protein [Arcobacter sp. FWKO B]